MTTKVEEKPLYLGHRERLRQRFMVDDGASMSDYELLELLLTMAIPRRDVKPLAKKLINRFGDIGEVLHTPAHELMDAGVSVNTIVLIRLVAACGMRSAYAGFRDSNEPIFSNWIQFEEYCREKMAYKEIEEFRVFFLDASYRLKGEKLITTGTVNKSSIHPREVIRAALDNKAVYIIMAHNHPSGDVKPSDADILMTKNFEELTSIMDIVLFDHLIVGREGTFSFRAAGYIKDKKKKDE
ncbi:MAG: DNA repair protein RadC [Alphaproteobacteria bacterium]|nr:DNA repair protein RadC [Alphaproteobacteria bacterium]